MSIIEIDSFWYKKFIVVSALSAVLLIYSLQFRSAFLPCRSPAAQQHTWSTQYRTSDVAENLVRFLYGATEE